MLRTFREAKYFFIMKTDTIESSRISTTIQNPPTAVSSELLVVTFCRRVSETFPLSYTSL